MGTVRQSTAASALTRCLSPADMGQGHWSRVGLARRLCCAARCQGGQLADRKTAKGDAEVARRRPDCSTVTCVFCSYSKACEMGNVEVCCLLGDHTAARSRGREFSQALGVTVGAMSRRKRPKDAGRSTDCGRRPLELSSVEDAIQPGSQKADAPSSTPGTAIFMVLFLSTVLLRGTVGQEYARRPINGMKIRVNIVTLARPFSSCYPSLSHIACTGSARRN
ncbi:hypothetical protein BHE74_00010163 [Ensete ventricosum]|nr:hypothetical protein BHE74_00010163 [Ensete ventricosum]